MSTSDRAGVGLPAEQNALARKATSAPSGARTRETRIEEVSVDPGSETNK